MKTFAFLRHAEYQESGELSEKGVKQAEQRAESLKGLPPFDLAVSSDALRARQTAEIILKTLKSKLEAATLTELHWPSNEKDKQTVKHMLQKLGKAPLYEYIKQDRNDSWKRYVEEAWNALSAIIIENQAENILVVSHANIINSLGLMINSNALDLNKCYFGFCEGFALYDNSSDVQYYCNQIMS